MRIWFVPWFAAVVLLVTTVRADVAISLRYFKEVGTSHFHVYLYSDDGKVIRQLTAPEDAHDTLPMFSKDGSEIIFTRARKGKKQACSIRLDGSHLMVLESNPAGYPPPNPEDREYGQGEQGNDAPWKSRGDDLFMLTPDGKQEVILKAGDNFKRKDPSFSGNGFRALTLRDLAVGKETGVVTSGDAPDAYCDFALCSKSPFLWQPKLHALVYWQWQGSTAGPRYGVIDLDGRRAMFVSQNPALILRHGTRSGFFSLCEDRYQPLGKTGHTVNCEYLDWWNAKLERIRFARAICRFGGASVRVKGQPPMDIPSRD